MSDGRGRGNMAGVEERPGSPVVFCHRRARRRRPPLTTATPPPGQNRESPRHGLTLALRTAADTLTASPLTNRWRMTRRAPCAQRYPNPAYRQIIVTDLRQTATAFGLGGR